MHAFSVLDADLVREIRALEAEDRGIHQRLARGSHPADCAKAEDL